MWQICMVFYVFPFPFPFWAIRTCVAFRVCSLAIFSTSLCINLLVWSSQYFLLALSFVAILCTQCIKNFLYIFCNQLLNKCDHKYMNLVNCKLYKCSCLYQRQVPKLNRYHAFFDGYPTKFLDITEILFVPHAQYT